MACTLHLCCCVFVVCLLGACVAVAAAELLRPADEGTTCFTMFVRFFLFSFSLSHRLLSSSSSSRVHHHHHHHHHANDGLRALSIYLSIYQFSQFSSVLFWPKLFWANLCLKIIGHRVFFLLAFSSGFLPSFLGYVCYLSVGTTLKLLWCGISFFVVGWVPNVDLDLRGFSILGAFWVFTDSFFRSQFWGTLLLLLYLGRLLYLSLDR